MKNRKGIIGVDGGKGICNPWKEKSQCSQGDRCIFSHDAQDREQKPEHTAATLPPHLPSQPIHEVEVCRGREASETKVTMGPFFDNRVEII